MIYSDSDDLARALTLNAWQADEIARLRAAIEHIREHTKSAAPAVVQLAHGALYPRLPLAKVRAESETLCSGHRQYGGSRG